MLKPIIVMYPVIPARDEEERNTEHQTTAEPPRTQNGRHDA